LKHSPKLDLHYTIEQFYFDQQRDSRWYLRRIGEAVRESAGAAPTGARFALDVACGTAQQAARLSRQGWRMVGVDASDDMLRLGHYISWDVLLSVRLARSIAETLPFRDASFDLVVCQGSLDHFARPRLFMAEAARVLAPGGRLVIALANYDSLSCRLGRFGARRSPAPRHAPPTDLAYWETPFDHTFKGTYRFLVSLGTKDLELERAFGVSLFQFTMAWRLGLKALPEPAARALWRTMDALGRRLPYLADTGIAVWRKRGKADQCLGHVPAQARGSQPNSPPSLLPTVAQQRPSPIAGWQNREGGR
jgi:SAM-dependent methyltransferase